MKGEYSFSERGFYRWCTQHGLNKQYALICRGNEALRIELENEYKKELAELFEKKQEQRFDNKPDPEFRNVEIRGQLIQRYGEHCELCPNSYFGFLELDHINGGGYAHLKRCGNRAKMYQEILAEGYRPDKYRTLCKVCNQLSRFFSDDEIRAWWKPQRFPKGE